MARFDLSQYATVAERLAQFHKDYPDGRIVSTLVGQNDMGNGKFQWVVRTEIYLSAEDQAMGLVKGTGFAAETDGSGGANNVAALPNAETSSLGRALMSVGYAMNKDPNTLASREEMQKVENTSPVEVMHQFAQRDWKKDADTLNDVEALRTLWANAKAKKAPNNVLDYIKERANALSNTGSVSRGTEGSLPGLFAETEGSGATGQIDPEPKAKGRK